jgi:Lon protease-like protein
VRNREGKVNLKSIQFDVPPQAPVMVLSNATLFPHALLPLYIFEPRYRDMLAWSLEHHRMFCIALTKRGLAEARTADQFHHVAGIGFIRACVGHEDGSSHLILQGLVRVEMTGFVQERPFRMATLSPVATEPVSDEEGEILSAQILEYCAHFQAQGAKIPETLDEQLASVDDPAMLCDIVTHTFIRDPQRRQSVLEETKVANRLRTLIRHLGEEML